MAGLGVGFTAQRLVSSLDEVGGAITEAEGAVRTLAGESFNQYQASIAAVVKESDGLTNAIEAQQASYQLLSAGVSGAADVSQVLADAVKLSRAGFTDTTTSVDALTNVLNGYGLAASEAQRISDQLVQTQNDGKITVDQYARNLGKVVPVASALGVSFEEVNAAIAQTTAVGLSADVATTGLKSAITKLTQPTVEGSKILKKYGVEINAATVKADGFAKTLQKLSKVTDKGDLGKLLGQEAGVVITPILNQLERYTELLENQRKASGTTARAIDDLSGSYGALKKELDNKLLDAQVQAFKDLEPALAQVTAGVLALIDAWNSLPDGVRQAITVIGTLALAIAAVAVALAGIGLAIKGVIAGLKAFKLALASAKLAVVGFTGATTLLGAALVALPWVALAAGVTALGVAIYKGVDAQRQWNDLVRDGAGTTEELKSGIEKVKEKLIVAQNRLQGTGGEMKATGRAAAALKKEVALLKGQLEDLEGTYYVRIRLEQNGYTFDENGNAKTYEVGGITYDAKTGKAINPPKPIEIPDPIDKGLGSGSAAADAAASKAKAAADRAFQDQLRYEKLLLDQRLASEKEVAEYRQKLLQIQFNLEAAQLPENFRSLAEVVQQLSLQPFSAELDEVNRKILQAQQAVQQAEASQANGDEGAAARIKETTLALNGLLDARARLQEFADQATPLFDQTTIANGTQAIRDRTEALENETAMLRLKAELQAQGLKGSDLDLQLQLAEVERERAAQLEFLNEKVANYYKVMLNAKIGTKEFIEAARGYQNTQKLVQSLDASYQGLAQAIRDANAAAKAQEKGKLQQYMDGLQESIDDTQGQLVAMASAVESAIGSAFNEIVNDVISGNANIAESFSKMFAQIGKAFIKMATEMIAKALVLKALQALGVPIMAPTGFNAASTPLGAGGGNVGGIGTLGPNFGIAQETVAGINPVASNGISAFSGAASLFSPSNPGTVQATPETGVAFETAQDSMQSSRQVMVDQAQTRREDNFYEAAGDPESSLNQAIEVRYDSTVINETRYVTAEEFEKGVSAATVNARAQAFKDLKNRPAARAKVGMR